MVSALREVPQAARAAFVAREVSVRATRWPTTRVMTAVVEAIFAQYAFRAATNLDLPAIMGVALFVGFVYVTINFIVDVLYGTIDPRIRLE